MNELIKNIKTFGEKYLNSETIHIAFAVDKNYIRTLGGFKISAE